MSYGRELMDEMEVEAAVQFYELRRDIKLGIWTMKDGRRINIEEMTDKHLKNVIRLLERRKANKDEVAAMWLPTMRRELYFRTREDPFLDALSVEDYTN